MSHPRILPVGFTDGYVLPAAYLNAWDGYIADSLDKTGDTVSGPIDFADGATLTFDSGSLCHFLDGSQVTFDSASTVSGTIATATLNISSGSITTALGVPITLNGSTFIGTLTAGSTILLSATSFDRSVALTPSYSSNLSADGNGVISQSATSGATCIVPCKLPHNAVITSFFGYMQGAGGHAGLPATMPTIILKRVQLSSGTVSTIATATDASASLATYEASHAVTASSLSHTVDTSAYGYFFTLTGEGSTNALTGLQVFSLIVRCTVSELALG